MNKLPPRPGSATGAGPGGVCCYFAYGSNMNPARVAARGLRFGHVEAARLAGYALRFEKHSKDHVGTGHANIAWDRAGVVEGVLFWLSAADEIRKMDRFERAPINYSREVVVVETAEARVAAWTYFANPAVLMAGLRPQRAYLEHLLAGAAYLSPSYAERLRGWPCAGEPPT
jgi:cation transport regulator ChaC